MRRGLDISAAVPAVLKRSIGVAAIVIAAVWLASVQPALASVDAAGTKIWSFSDGHPEMSPANTEAYAARQCLTPAPRARTVSISASLKTAQALIDADTTAKARRAYAHGQQARSERGSLIAAVAAISAGKQDAALAAFVRAHALAPKDLTPLEGLAVLLTNAGKPNEALALLRAAARLTAPKSSPFGIDRKAILLDDQGYAMMGLHEWAAAARAESAAASKAPLLTEAERNLGVALECQGKKPQAARALFLGAGRQQWAGDELLPGPGDNFQFPDPTKAFDTSFGTTLTLPVFTYPTTVAAARAKYEALAALYPNDGLDAIKAYNARYQILSDNLNAQHLNPLSRRRVQDILGAMGYTSRLPELQAVEQRANAAFLTERTADGKLVGGQSGLHCDQYPQFITAVQAWDQAIRPAIAAEYKINTGLAANLGNPAAHALAEFVAAHDASTELYGMFELALQKIRLVHYGCTDPPVDDGQPVVHGTLETPESPECPKALQGTDFALDLHVLAITVNCEEVGIDAATEGWLGLFGTVTHNVKTGSTTVFVGPQAGVSLKEGPFGAGATFRDGLYLTVGADGSVQDVGMRVAPSANVSVQNLAAYRGDQMDFSFVGASPFTD